MRKNISIFFRQCVQAAIANELETMYKENPNQKAGIVTFNSEVCIIGDGSSDPITIMGDKLNNFQQLFEAGEKAIPARTIKETKGVHNLQKNFI